jgi:serine/threonine-protein kinase RsbW
VDSAVVETPRELSIRADGGSVRTASSWLEVAANAHHAPPDQVYRLDLCLNEALANIIEHGGGEAQTTPVELSLEFESDAEGQFATLAISDSGRAFNPLTASHKARAVSLADAEPGGLGLGLISSLADEVGYRYESGRNILTFVIRWSADS